MKKGEEMDMMRFIATVVVSVLLLSTAALADEALAQRFERGEHREGGPRVVIPLPVPAPERREFREPERRYYESRRFWRGRWWDYGVGPCWEIGPYGRYVWVCD